MISCINGQDSRGLTNQVAQPSHDYHHLNMIITLGGQDHPQHPQRQADPEAAQQARVRGGSEKEENRNQEYFHSSSDIPDIGGIHRSSQTSPPLQP